MAKARDPFMDLHFPKAGLSVEGPLSKQPARPMANKQYARTAAAGVNVRTYEPSSNRDRGGSRPGLAKYHPALVSELLGGTDEWVIQNLAVISNMGVLPPGGSSVQTSQQGRVVSILAVSQGVVKVAQPGDLTWSTPTNLTGNTPPLNFDGLLFSTNLNQKQFFVDGTNYVYWDPTDNSVNTWTPTDGLLPVDVSSNTARLCCTWRGRMVLSGLFKDPQNWFMSRKDDPFDWEYGADDNDVTQAVAGNNSPAGTVGDVVNSFVPYTDDVLIFGGDSTLWLMQGDPMYGGQIDRLSDSIGMAFGRPWCKDPFGAVYFFSSRNSIFRLVPGKELTRVSGPIQRLLDDIDTGNTSITMAWDERAQGFHTFITPLQRGSDTLPQETIHYFFESRAGAWWQDKFTSPYHNPLCCAVMDGNEPADRVVIAGGWDGYVRSIDRDAETDDGRKIASSVLIGPILTSDMDDMLLKNVQAVMAAESGDVEYEVLVADTAEEALSCEPVSTGKWSAGRNPTDFVRMAGYAIYIRLRSTNRWAMESIRAEITSRGKVRMRDRLGR